MATIKKVIRCLNKGDHAIIEVELDDGGAAEIYVGGEVETWFDHRYNKAKAHVIRAQSRKDLTDTSITSTLG